MRELGVRRHEAMTLGRIGLVNLARNDAESARAHFTRADDLALGGVERRHGLYRAGAAASLARLGDAGEADKLLASARAILTAVGDPGYLAAAWVFEGFVLLARGDAAGARARVDASGAESRDVARLSDARAARLALEAALDDRCDGLAARSVDGGTLPATRLSIRPAAAVSLVVGADGRWFEATGPGRVDLAPQGPPPLAPRPRQSTRPRAGHRARPA